MFQNFKLHKVEHMLSIKIKTTYRNIPQVTKGIILHVAEEVTVLLCNKYKHS